MKTLILSFSLTNLTSTLLYKNRIPNTEPNIKHQTEYRTHELTEWHISWRRHPANTRRTRKTRKSRSTWLSWFTLNNNNDKAMSYKKWQANLLFGHLILSRQAFHFHPKTNTFRDTTIAVRAVAERISQKIYSVFQSRGWYNKCIKCCMNYSLYVFLCDQKWERLYMLSFNNKHFYKKSFLL